MNFGLPVLILVTGFMFLPVVGGMAMWYAAAWEEHKGKRNVRHK